MCMNKIYVNNILWGRNFVPFYLQVSDASSLKENLKKKLNFCICRNGRTGFIKTGNKISISEKMDSEGRKVS